jgi:hypothetical protein
VGVSESYQDLPFLAVWTGCVCRRTHRGVSARPGGRVGHPPPERLKYGCLLPPSPHPRALPPSSQAILQLPHKHTTSLIHSTTMSLHQPKKSPSSCEAQCPDCGVTLSRQADMNRHRKTKHSDGTEIMYVGGTTPNDPGLIICQ